MQFKIEPQVPAGMIIRLRGVKITVTKRGIALDKRVNQDYKILIMNYLAREGFIKLERVD